VCAALGVLAACLVICGAGCGQQEPEADGFGDINGLFVADDGIHVVPARGWRREGEVGGSFRKTANLLVFIRGVEPEGLRVTYTPDRETRPLHFMASWDEVPLWQTARSGEGGDLVAEVSASVLTPGLHRLRLEHVKQLDPETGGPRDRNVFDRVTVERLDAGQSRLLQIVPNGYLAQFLDFGVASKTATKQSGCLFFGSQTLDVGLDGRGGTASFTLENQSPAEARFLVRIDGEAVIDEELESNGRRRIELEVPTGRHGLTLQTEGVSNGCFLWGAPYLRERSRVKRPTVVVITLDTTRRDVVSPYSQRPELTPVLHEFSKRASVYANAYSTSPWTLPSHASIFTGLYPSNHRAGVIDDVLSPEWPTLAELYRGVGYRTAGFVGGLMASSRFGLARGFHTYRDPRKFEEPADVISDSAVRFIDLHAGSPLFLFLNYFDPHGPYMAPPDFESRLGVKRLRSEVPSVPGWGAYARDEPGALKRILNGEFPPNPEGLALLRARYEAEVAFMDDQVGRVFDSLRAHGLYDNALIAVVSDHGEFLGERGLFSHSYRLDRELTAVPMLVKWPGQTETEVVQELVSQVDLFAALASMIGPVPRSIDGIAFSRHDPSPLADRDLVFLEEHESRFHQLDGPFRVSGHLYGMQWLDIREVFFPGSIECTERSGGDWHPVDCPSSWEQRIEGLPETMKAPLDRVADFDAGDIDEATAESLRALGYLE
jgi:hypothetical protein